MERRRRQGRLIPRFTTGGIVAKAIYSFPGGRRFHFIDPGGNELAVWSDAGEDNGGHVAG